jgi:hypothetical protein
VPHLDVIDCSKASEKEIEGNGKEHGNGHSCALFLPHIMLFHACALQKKGSSCTGAARAWRMSAGKRPAAWCLCRYYVHIESVRAEVVAAMDTPDTAQRLHTYQEQNVTRLVKAPRGNPRPFIEFDGPLYKIQ